MSLLKTIDGSVLLQLASAGVLAGVCVRLAIPALMPLFRRYAMARPSARGSHRIPTPQGGGVPIIAAVIALTLVAGIAGIFDGMPIEVRRYYTLALGATLAMALLGAADDMRPMSAMARFVIQTILATVVVFAAPDDWRIVPFLPQWIERAVLVVGFVWMVNLTNFMDGIDGIVIAEVMPMCHVLALIAAAGLLSLQAGLIAIVLAGAMAGFSPFNRHPAKLFLGDVGSLPVGFLLAVLLFELSATRSLAAALLLPLYFLADATGTLLIGLLARQDVTKPHRRHAYQRAVDGGWTAPAVTRAVVLLNLMLAALALMALEAGGIVAALCGAAGLAATVVMLRRFGAAPR